MSAESAIADVIPNHQSQAEIFKLKMDHFEELFDWLSLEDLVLLSKTCKRMQHIVGYHIKTNYGAIKFQSTSDGIYVRDKWHQCFGVKFDGLSTFLKRLIFLYLEHFQNDCWYQTFEKTSEVIPHMNADQFESLTEIHLASSVVFTDEGISRITEILPQVETVKLDIHQFLDANSDFYDTFLQFCTNIKKLYILGWSSTPTGNNWLLQKYHNLEHFQLTTRSDVRISELQTFFEQNTNIKSFATEAEVILENRNTFNRAELKLDILSIVFSPYGFRNNAEESLKPRRDILNELHKRGVFNELHAYFSSHYDLVFNQEAVNQLALFNGTTKLFIDDIEDDTDLSPLINLKHLCIGDTFCIKNIMALSKNLINLEFIQFKSATFDDILPFIRHSPKLNTLVAFRFEGNYENIFKIEELNEERSKLVNARKITIYVEEHVYLVVKWSKNQTNWSLIEIKRGASYDTLSHNFDYVELS